MGEHKLPKAKSAPINPEWENHIRESRLPSALNNYVNAPPGAVDGVTRMWAARYADDVALLLAEIDRLRAAK